MWGTVKTESSKQTAPEEDARRTRQSKRKMDSKAETTNEQWMRLSKEGGEGTMDESRKRDEAGLSTKDDVPAKKIRAEASEKKVQEPKELEANSSTGPSMEVPEQMGPSSTHPSVSMPSSLHLSQDLGLIELFQGVLARISVKNDSLEDSGDVEKLEAQRIVCAANANMFRLQEARKDDVPAEKKLTEASEKNVLKPEELETINSTFLFMVGPEQKGLSLIDLLMSMLHFLCRFKGIGLMELFQRVLARISVKFGSLEDSGDVEKLEAQRNVFAAFAKISRLHEARKNNSPAKKIRAEASEKKVLKLEELEANSSTGPSMEVPEQMGPSSTHPSVSMPSSSHLSQENALMELFQEVSAQVDVKNGSLEDSRDVEMLEALINVHTASLNLTQLCKNCFPNCARNTTINNKETE